jgi:prevent-host-death family protein
MTTMRKITRSVSATEFKAKCLDLMDRVAERRETYTITKHGKPVAQLAPVPVPLTDGISGCLRGQAWEVSEILTPVAPAESWEAIAERPVVHPRGRRPAPMRKPGARRR